MASGGGYISCDAGEMSSDHMADLLKSLHFILRGGVVRDERDVCKGSSWLPGRAG